MKYAVLPLDHHFEDDTVYRADRPAYDFAEKDTILADDPRYYLRGHGDPLHTVFYLRNLKNVTLDFGGAVLTLHGKIQPFLLDGCENVSVRNVTVRYDRCPYTQGEIVSSDAERLVLKIGSDFPYRVEDGELVIVSDTWENRDLDKAPMFLQNFDAATRQGRGIHLVIFGKNPQIDPSLPWAKSTVQFAVSEENGLLVLTKKGEVPIPSDLRPGQLAVIGHERRNISNIQMVCCKNVTLTDYRILNGTGMGIFPFHCENVTLDRIRMTFDEQSPSIIANAADGIHAFACSGEFVIRDSVVEGTIDDILNIHSNFYSLKSVSGSTITAETCLEPIAQTPLFLAGDRIRVCHGHTQEPAAEYTLLSVEPVAEKRVRFTLDRPVESHEENDVIENLSTQCRITIRNCRFGKCNSHLRFQSRGDILIENTETEAPFLLTGDMTYWYESSPCEHFKVRDTAFRTSRAVIRSCPEFVPTERQPYYHGDIDLENCTFDDSVPVTAEHARSVTMKNCRRTDSGAMTVRLTGCGKADCEDVLIERK